MVQSPVAVGTDKVKVFGLKLLSRRGTSLQGRIIVCSFCVAAHSNWGSILAKISNRAILEKSWKSLASRLSRLESEGSDNKSSSEIIQPHRASMNTRFIFFFVVLAAALALLVSVAAADGPPRTCAELCEVARKACFAACKTDEWDCICSIKFQACVSKCGSVE